ncbi:MAG: DNA-directed RNA polymerase subunit beta' [Oscillospiraceae bacterium]|jgi:DNA-directed RNA polymerase subunit beta'|nr:DNA-directed RNA polymerase subunit beta' [Oscillospiraceae bacterium]
MDFNDFKFMKIGLASPEKIRGWSNGEVKKPETINYRSLKPETDGLFCERIFGPQKDWECHCGRYKRIRYRGKICERCGVEVTRCKVRRERMGHIELAAPVSHVWYFKGIPSRLSIMLEMSPRVIEKVLYFASYVVTNSGDVRELYKGQVLSEKEYRDMREKYEDDFEAGMGAEAIKKLLCEIDLDLLASKLKEELSSVSGQKKLKILKRLEITESFRQSGNRPEWMIFDVIPVIPPDLRPMVQLDGGRFATSDLNDLYRRVINRNNRLKRLLGLGAPDIIVRNEKRMLQEAVDALIDNGRRGRPVVGANNRPLKSLSDMLKGKQGRFRQNLLGKRVDYSGRSVIVVGPELKIYQCGLPKEMALELFKPFVMRRLVEIKASNNIKAARKAVERIRPEVWDALDVVIKGHLVLLNRAPTLHRLGIQAFEPILVEGRALKLHPLVCYAYNADFDGDQMAVHVPLSVEAQAEARFLMLSSGNLLKPSDGRPVTVPTKDMVLGTYYLTMKDDKEEGKFSYFRDENEALMAYDNGVISLHDAIKVRRGDKFGSKIIEITAGRIIFNQGIPQDLGIVNRSISENRYDFEIDFLVGKKQLDLIFDKCIRIHGSQMTSEVLDKIKDLGFKYATRGAITISVKDAVIPEEKSEIIDRAEDKIDVIVDYYRDGLISNSERKTQVLKVWSQATDEVTAVLKNSFPKRNPIFMMVDSGARGSMSQVKQLSGMRGLIASTTGTTIEIPIRSNYREGLNVLEYFISSRGARKGSSDTSLRTADSGYLTRRLVDVSHDIIIRADDCGIKSGLKVFEIKDGKETIEPFSERLLGRYLVNDFLNENGKVVISKDKLMNSDDVEKIISSGTKKIEIRSVLRCICSRGICKKCYGANLATGLPAALGEAVGIIAAQSIGEPGTQLTMKTFHTGGIVGIDITQGLPRVEELFEARKPKKLAIISEISGKIREKEIKNNKCIIVCDEETGLEKEYMIPFGSRVLVEDGDTIEAGGTITEGSVNPQDILSISGVAALEAYLIQEVQKVYRFQGVDINDKHIEVIVRQMMQKVRVDNHGNTGLLANSIVERSEFEAENEKIRKLIEKGEDYLQEATCNPIVLGITKASLSTDSFLSAASFQETTRVLTEAAVKGKLDPLAGLKENVMIGKLLPAGTGLDQYNKIRVEINNPMDCAV